MTVYSFDSFSTSSITLNNMGVALAERRNYEDAIATFTDSLEVFFAGQRHLKDSYAFLFDSVRKSPSPAEVEHKVYRAHLLLCGEVDLPPPLIPLTTIDEASPSAVSSMEEITIRNQYGYDMTMRKPANPEAIHEVNEMFLVYFQHPNHSHDPARAVAALLATILHNKAQTYRLMSQLVRHSSIKRESELLLERSVELSFHSEKVASAIIKSSPPLSGHARQLFDDHATVNNRIPPDDDIQSLVHFLVKKSSFTQVLTTLERLSSAVREKELSFEVQPPHTTDAH